MCRVYEGCVYSMYIWDHIHQFDNELTSLKFTKYFIYVYSFCVDLCVQCSKWYLRTPVYLILHLWASSLYCYPDTEYFEYYSAFDASDLLTIWARVKIFVYWSVYFCRHLMLHPRLLHTLCKHTIHFQFQDKKLPLTTFSKHFQYKLRDVIKQTLCISRSGNLWTLITSSVRTSIVTPWC